MTDHLRTKIIINDETLEQVNQFTYLGCNIRVSYQFSNDVGSKMAKFLQLIGSINLLKLNDIYIYRVSQEERSKLRESVPYVKLYRYNPKHLYPKLNGYGDNGKRSLKL